MIRFKNRVWEDYFIDTLTAVITDRNGNVEPIKIKNGRSSWRGCNVYQIQMHTAFGYIDYLVIHHIDFNKANDALSNLQYLTKEHHSRIHSGGNNNPFAGRHWDDDEKDMLSEAHLGNVWWSKEGEKPIQAKECPGDGWVRGRNTLKGKEPWNKGKPQTEETKKLLSEKIKGMKKWNNGIKNMYAKECPGSEWKPGFISKKH